MKATKVRNYQIYRATNTTRSKQIASPLSKELRKKYGKRSIRIMLGDTVKIIRGEYQGIDGKISKISIDSGCVAVEGIKKEKSKGDKFDILIPTSKVLITGLNLDDHWRKSKLEGKKPKTTPKTVTKEITKDTSDASKPEEPKKKTDAKIQKKSKNLKLKPKKPKKTITKKNKDVKD